MFRFSLAASVCGALLGIFAVMGVSAAGSAGVGGVVGVVGVTKAKFEVQALGLSYDVALTLPPGTDGYGVFTGPRYETGRKPEDYGTAVMGVSTPKHVVFRKLSAEVVEYTDAAGSKFWVIANGGADNGYAVSITDAGSTVVARGTFTGTWMIDEGQGGARSIPAFAAYLTAATVGTPRPPTFKECQDSAAAQCGGQTRVKSVEYTVKPDGTVTCKIECKG